MRTCPLPAGCWGRYLSTYADAEPGHVWAAVFAAATLFLDAAHQAAEALALPVNEAEAEGSLRYLYRVRELPADASEIFLSSCFHRPHLFYSVQKRRGSENEPLQKNRTIDKRPLM